MNGVCVIWRGWIELIRLDGTGCLEFDEDRARVSTSFTAIIKRDNIKSCEEIFVLNWFKITAERIMETNQL